MGDSDKKTITAMLKQVESLNKVIAFFKGMSDRTMSEPDSPHKEAKLRKYKGHINYLENFMKKLKDVLEKETEDAKKKREKLRMIKTGYYLAAVYNKEIGGFTPEVMNIYNDDIINRIPDEVGIQIISAFHNILHSAKEKNISEDKLDKILSDKEFADMEKNDPHRLAKKKKEINEEFNSIVKFLAGNQGDKLAVDKDGNVTSEAIKENFKRQLKRLNGFENSMKSFERYMPEIKDNDFQDIIDGITELAKITRELQDAAVNNEEVFDRSNGYGPELLEKEMPILRRVIDYNAKMATQMLDTLDPSKPGNVNDLLESDFMMRYALMRELDYHVRRQVKVDGCLVRNNEILSRMDEWETYKDMKGRMSELGKSGATALKIRLRACSKVNRIISESASYDEDVQKLTDYVVETTQGMIEILNKNGEPTPEEQGFLKRGVAALTAYGILRDNGNKDNEAKTIVDELRKSDTFENYEGVTDIILASDDFKAKYDKMFGKNPKKSDFYSFLAGDLEAKFSPVPVKKPEKELKSGKNKKI